MAKARLAKKSQKMVVQEIYRRKDALENKLFQMKYTKLLRAISSSNRMLNAGSGTFAGKVSSIYEENPSDPKTEIPANKFMFENIIKDAFEIQDSSESGEEEKGFLS